MHRPEKDALFLHTINFALDNMLKLSVFVDWNSISMDQKGLFVQIRVPSTLDKDKIVTCLNNATKAIFLVEEIDMQEIPLHYEGVGNSKKIQPKEIGLKTQYFAPSTPFSNRRLEQCVEEFLDVDFEPRHKKFRKDNNEANITSVANRLEAIVEEALSVVNQSLSSGISPEENKQENPGSSKGFKLFPYF